MHGARTCTAHFFDGTLSIAHTHCLVGIAAKRGVLVAKSRVLVAISKILAAMRAKHNAHTSLSNRCAVRVCGQGARCVHVCVRYGDCSVHCAHTNVFNE